MSNRNSDFQEVSVYKFLSLQAAISFFEAKGVDLTAVYIEGGYGGNEPTEDDDPVFTWEVNNAKQK